MKPTYVTIFLISVFLLFSFTDVNVEPVAKVSFKLGEVYKINKKQRNLQKASIDEQLFPGDRIETKKESRCEILYRNGSVVRMDQYSIYKINKVTYKEGIKDEGMLSFGKIWANIVKMVSGKPHYQVKTPTAVAAIRGTVYQVESDSIHSSFKVFEGGIDVTPTNLDTNEGKTTFKVDRGEEFVIVNNFDEFRKRQEEAFLRYQEEQQKAFENFMQQDEKEFREFQQKDLAAFQKFQKYHILLDKFNLEEEKKDDWVKWNLERDRALNR